MRRSVLILVLAACDAEGDQRVRCTAAADDYFPQTWERKGFVEQCVKERWSNKQMACHAQNAGMLGAFCDD